jgi:hypothetical protein
MSKIKTTDRMKHNNTLYEYHMKYDLRVRTDGTGKSWVEVPDGNDLGGHLSTVERCATVHGWPVIRRNGLRLVPTYAYDRVVVAGVRFSLPSAA